MNFINIQVTSQMQALQHVAKVRDSGYTAKVKFGDCLFGDNEVCFKKDYRNKGLKVDSVSIGFDTDYIFWASDMQKLSEEKMLLVGAAMMKLNVQAMAWDDYIVTLEQAAHAVVIERTIIVERESRYERPARPERPQRPVVVQRTQTTYSMPERDPAAEIGAAVGSLLGQIFGKR